MKKKKKRKKIGNNVSLEQKDGVTIIHISNNLSYQTADELRDAHQEIKDDKILFDLGLVKTSTSRGMAAIVRIILASEEKSGQVALYNVSKMCNNIIEAMQLIKHVPSLKIFDTFDEGMEYLRDN